MLHAWLLNLERQMALQVAVYTCDSNLVDALLIHAPLDCVKDCLVVILLKLHLWHLGVVN